MNDIFQATNNNYSDTVTTKVMKCAINNAIYQLSFVVCKSYLQLYKSRWSIYEKVGCTYNLNKCMFSIQAITKLSIKLIQIN